MKVGKDLGIPLVHPPPWRGVSDVLRLGCSGLYFIGSWKLPTM